VPDSLFVEDTVGIYATWICLVNWMVDGELQFLFLLFDGQFGERVSASGDLGRTLKGPVGLNLSTSNVCLGKHWQASRNIRAVSFGSIYGKRHWELTKL
jgi:hypothetical protein